MVRHIIIIETKVYTNLLITNIEIILDMTKRETLIVNGFVMHEIPCPRIYSKLVVWQSLIINDANIEFFDVVE